MDPIKVMVNGLPGSVSSVVAAHIEQSDRFTLIPTSLTGPEITDASYRLENLKVRLVLPANRDQIIDEIKASEGFFISVDYTHPQAVNDNAAFYCRNEMPFVMGTTGGDRVRLSETVAASNIPAVIAPNMAKQIVGFQAMMEYAADTFPNLFSGYRLTVKESHQKGKADTSGTAKAMVAYFNRLGIPFSEQDIHKERDPDRQQSEWQIPPSYLTGHGWHTYTLDSDDSTVRFEFKHNVNGRDIYAKGTLDAIAFLNKKVGEGNAGKVFSMIDVLKG
jgi:4-hydroxy-tetrahydrodipicolinate reductase